MLCILYNLCIIFASYSMVDPRDGHDTDTKYRYYRYLRVGASMVCIYGQLYA